MSNPLLPWMKMLVARIPSEPEDIIQDELVQVVHDFCREGYPWRELLRGYKVMPGCEPVDINPIDGRRQAIHVVKAYVAGRELAHAPHDVPRDGLPEGIPSAFVCEQGPTRLTLLPAPDRFYTLDVLVTLCPKCPEKWMPELFRTHHFEALLDGTLGRFYNQPMKPYTDKDQARYHLRRYRALIQEARHMSDRGYTRAGSDWSFPGFGV